MDISLARVLEAARERRATLTAEVAGYVILLAAQQLAAERFQVSARSVLLDEAGDVFLEPGAAASELEVETALRGLLRALVSVGSSPPPAIAAVAERGPSGDLCGLVAELSAALIPINHSAAHRALARLHREARRGQGEAGTHGGHEVLLEPDARARDLLASELPARDAGVERGSGDGAVISYADADGAGEPAEEQRRDPPAARPRPTEVRSDVQQLLDAFLPETRRVEPMLRVLHDMIGLDLRSRREASSAPASIEAAPR